MRFFEIASPQATKLDILATKRFVKNAQIYLRGGYQGLADTLREFLEFKTHNPTEVFGSKDAPFIGNPALKGKGIWHCHLVHGKVIIIYRPYQGTLYLYDIAEHTAFDTPKECAALGQWIEGLGSKNFVHYGAPTPKTKLNLPNDEWDLGVRVVLPEAEMQELDALFYEMAVHDRNIIEDAIRGNIADIMEFMVLAVPETPATLLEAFGGVEGLKKHLKAILKQMGG